MVDSQESNSSQTPYSDRGRTFAVEAKLLDVIHAILRRSPAGQVTSAQLQQEARRIIEPLVWTEEDVRSMDELDEPNDWQTVFAGLDNAGEFEYAQSQVNEAIEERAAKLIAEGD